MTIGGNAGRLAMLAAELSRKWQQTRPYWRDAKSQSFEKDYVNLILASVNGAIEAIQQLDEIITRIRRDCE